MILITNPGHDPYFNIAAEEFLIKNSTDEVLLIYRNMPSVIVGKHQNLLTEVNLNYVKRNKIPVVRRISGGGTVYHDLGNLNISVIKINQPFDKRIEFTEFTKPIIEFLNTQGINAEFKGKNNLTVKGKKISGNSAHAIQYTVMHHGTLLFNTDLENLNKTISSKTSGSISGPAVKSIRARVANIADLVKKPISIEEFIEKLQFFLTDFYNISTIRPFFETEISAIQQLAEKKYKNWEWTYGYSPPYIFKNSADVNGQTVSIRLSVKNCIIMEAEIDIPGQELLSQAINKQLMYTAHQKQDILKQLKRINNIFELTNIKAKDLIHLFF